MHIFRQTSTFPFKITTTNNHSSISQQTSLNLNCSLNPCDNSSLSLNNVPSRYVRVWDIFSPSENPCRIGLQEYPLCCRFSSRPGIIATGDKFGRLMIWGMCDSHYHMGPQGSKNILCHHRKFFNSTSPDSTSADNTSDTEDSIFKKPYKLQHLCRLAVRTIVPDSTLLEKYFDLLGEHTILPKPLLAYLCYKDIKSQERVVSPNYPYIIN